jgi:hypothetical protein
MKSAIASAANEPNAQAARTAIVQHVQAKRENERQRDRHAQRPVQDRAIGVVQPFEKRWHRQRALAAAYPSIFASQSRFAAAGRNDAVIELRAS